MASFKILTGLNQAQNVPISQHLLHRFRTNIFKAAAVSHKSVLFTAFEARLLASSWLVHLHGVAPDATRSTAYSENPSKM